MGLGLLGLKVGGMVWIKALEGVGFLGLEWDKLIGVGFGGLILWLGR